MVQLTHPETPEGLDIKKYWPGQILPPPSCFCCCEWFNSTNCVWTNGEAQTNQQSSYLDVYGSHQMRHMRFVDVSNWIVEKFWVSFCRIVASLSSKNCCEYSLGNFCNIWATRYSNILVTLLSTFLLTLLLLWLTEGCLTQKWFSPYFLLFHLSFCLMLFILGLFTASFSVSRMGKISKLWQHFMSFASSSGGYLVCGKMFNLRWQFFSALAQILVVELAKYRTHN